LLERVTIRLQSVVDAAEAGERVVLARAGKPVAELVRFARKPSIKLGVLKGKFPKELLDRAVNPLTKANVKKLFGMTIEP
jgi:antitoxin (DNA-binding transcriptional repressor) of toxin-antitoxin stability system